MVGQSDREFEIRITNRSPRRIACVFSIDGLSIDGKKKAGLRQTAYVVGPHQNGVFRGWRTDQNTIERFKFTETAKSRAETSKKTPNLLGRIACAIFFEKDSQPSRRLISEIVDEQRQLAEHKESAEMPMFAVRGVTSLFNELGIGGGSIEGNRVRTVPFDWASTLPNLTLTLRYTSQAGLQWLGLHELESMPHDLELDGHGLTDLHHAVLNSDLDAVRRMVADGAFVDQPGGMRMRNWEYATPLHLAALRGEPEIATFLISAGADVEAKTSVHQDTPIMLCCFEDQGSVPRRLLTLTTLIKAGADINARSNTLHSSLHYAAAHNRPPMIGLLLNYGAKRMLHEVDDEDDTPAECAIAERKLVNAEYLHSFGGTSREGAPALPHFDAAEAYAIAWNTQCFDADQLGLSATADYVSPVLSRPVQGSKPVTDYLNQVVRDFAASDKIQRFCAEVAHLESDGRNEACVLCFLDDQSTPSGLIRFEVDPRYAVTRMTNNPWRELSPSLTASGWYPEKKAD